MYKSIDEWMQDPDFVLYISVVQQLGKNALPQAISRFKSELTDYAQGWREGESLEVEEKVVLVSKVKRTASYIGAKRLQQLAIAMEQPLAIGVDQPLDPMMHCLDEILQKLEHL